MRILTLAVGFARGTHEGALCEHFRARAGVMGNRIGFSSVGVQEIPPPDETVNPAGPETSEKVKGWVGMSGSVAVAVLV